MVYRWKSYSYKTDANIVGKLCEELAATVGLTPENLVDASRDKDAPVHSEFEWDDTIAAEGYRTQQARLMIGNLAIVIEVKEPETVRAFFSLNGGFRKNDGNFESIVTIMEDEQKRETLLEKAKQELRAFKKKYKLLNELKTVFDAIDEMEDPDGVLEE